MYKLLLVTDRPEVMEAYNAVGSWESLGFRAPRMVSTAQAAAESLKKHHADGIAYALNDAEEAALTRTLMVDHPLLPIIPVGRNEGEITSAVVELRSLLNRTHADFSDDSFGEADMMQICRHEFFRNLIGGNVATRADVMRRMRMLRSRMCYDRPCVLVSLEMPEGENFLRGRWHYGSDRLEVALRNIFGVELNGMRMLVSVLPDERVFLLACPMLGEEIAEDDSMTGIVTDHAQQSIEHVREYLDLHLNITGIRVLPALTALAREA